MVTEKSSSWQPCGARHVAVYGTLRAGGVNDIARLRPGIAPMGTTVLAGTLHDLGWYPGLCLAGTQPVLAEVVGFAGDRAYLMPTGEVHGLASGARVVPRSTPVAAPVLGAPSHPWRRSEDRTRHLPIGDGLLGRVVDSHGVPMDRLGPISHVHNEPLVRRPINAMDRDPVREPLDTGVRAINAMLTVGRGQRIGLFAGSGVGKSVLLGMMAKYTAADVIVVGLIGERGREVKEFIEDILGEEGLARAVVVAAPADAPPLTRMQGASYATAIAEHFRDRGQHVLLLMDSLTRYAMAQREIALAIGEPPATKGYPPSCFAKLPQLVERSGNGLNGCGSITAFYERFTVQSIARPPYAGKVTRAQIEKQINRFYYDTAAIPNDVTLAALAKMVPASQIVFGTDYPYRRAAEYIKPLEDFFKPDQIKMIERDNALRLVPRLKTA